MAEDAFARARHLLTLRNYALPTPGLAVQIHHPPPGPSSHDPQIWNRVRAMPLNEPLTFPDAQLVLNSIAFDAFPMVCRHSHEFDETTRSEFARYQAIPRDARLLVEHRVELFVVDRSQHFASPASVNAAIRVCFRQNDWLFSECLTKRFLTDLVRQTLLEAVMHEFDECFYAAGERYKDPHT